MITSVPCAAIGAHASKYVSAPVLKRISGLTMLAAAPMILLNTKSKSSITSDDTATNDVVSSEELAKHHEEELTKLRLKNRVQFTDVMAIQPFMIYNFLKENSQFVLLGIVTGLSSGLIGIGGGLVMNAYMGAATSMPQHEIVATSLLVAIPIGLSGSLVHYKAGRIDLKACTVIAACAFAACGVTSRFLADIDDANLKKVFTAVLVASAVNMIR
jgi:uncharacterized membrane protein YfcA